MSHDITAPIKRGTVQAERTEGGGRRIDFTVSNLITGKWRCSCGEEFINEKEAAAHYDEVN